MRSLGERQFVQSTIIVRIENAIRLRLSRNCFLFEPEFFFQDHLPSHLLFLQHERPTNHPPIIDPRSATAKSFRTIQPPSRNIVPLFEILSGRVDWTQWPSLAGVVVECIDAFDVLTLNKLLQHVPAELPLYFPDSDLTAPVPFGPGWPSLYLRATLSHAPQRSPSAQAVQPSCSYVRELVDGGTDPIATALGYYYEALSSDPDVVVMAEPSVAKILNMRLHDECIRINKIGNSSARTVMIRDGAEATVGDWVTVRKTNYERNLLSGARGRITRIHATESYSHSEYEPLVTVELTPGGTVVFHLSDLQDLTLSNALSIASAPWVKHRIVVAITDGTERVEARIASFVHERCIVIVSVGTSRPTYFERKNTIRSHRDGLSSTNCGNAARSFGASHD